MKDKSKRLQENNLRPDMGIHEEGYSSNTNDVRLEPEDNFKT